MPTTAKSLREILYGYRPGFHSAIKAQVAGEAIRLQIKETGHAEPEELVRRSKPKKSPTHNHFVWNDRACGQIHRRRQAGDLIAATYIVEERKVPGKKKKEQFFELQYVNAKVQTDRLNDYEDGGYVSTYISVEDAVADKRIQYDVLDQALKMIVGLRRRIEKITGSRADSLFLRKIEMDIAEEKRRRGKKKKSA